MWGDKDSMQANSLAGPLEDVRLSRFNTTHSGNFSEPLPVIPTKIFKYIIIAHPKAVVAQSALAVLTQNDPEAEILVVSDRYNFDDQQGSRLYSGTFVGKETGRQMITSFTASSGKSDLLPKLSSQPLGKNVEICTTAHVVSLDVENKVVTLSDGRVVSFGKCLLATGCKEAKLPGVPDHLKKHVTNLRKVKDFERVQKMVRNGEVKKIVVVGGGFLGCEVASKLKTEGSSKQVEIIHAYVEPGALYRYVPVYFSDYMTELLRAMGVQERPYHMVLQICEPVDKKHFNLNLVLQGFEKTQLDCDHVVFAPTHLEGNVELAEASGLEIDSKSKGVMVNSEMLARTDIYVAGDTASYPDQVLGRRRMQSYDHSFYSGALAARNMSLNGREAYNHLSVVSSHGGPLGLDVVVLGDIDSTMEMYSIAQTSGRFDPNGLVAQESDTDAKNKDDAKPWGLWEKGIVYYLRDRRVVGAMLLNLNERTDDVRNLIRSGLRYQHRMSEDSGSQRILELEDAIELGLESPICRHSSARGQGIMRNSSNKERMGNQA
ncbi:hypothetical protein GUITHDRAFT_113308 [Guillardia theta CCMP2712]|uniref:FAD/NAD(P)-binding domain-containing protein n=1 Tax=Guillardia theta (strain CCMP2712) TaxID=905079 RepID=L1IWN7_GUITC|nr:hypothetical protein GUITHDRAFT_113308 [Guillardia theta CCMP2712]EKX40522.1 hypothetical protein GUITHDRAFT_113308 [Guillardia theta CCMP2712]|eukprot:XP_005827502.1 hypothetical protein GUITHDRAFT_113308 [Guillardia theta CCMP2712]